MLTDEIATTLKGGNGGNGVVSFGKMAKSGPDGGNGGDGGNLYLEAASDLTLLNHFTTKQEFQAQSGIPGSQDKMSGAKGSDVTFLVPVGTNIKDLDTHEEWNLEEVGDKVLICRGGVGGKGNWEFRGPTNTTPMYAELGQKGQVRKVILTLKFIADYGLIGLPNAGKSSLLKELTNAKPKIANYAFTTLTANLGVLGNGKIITDIPGLIEGAHLGRGLGIRFLKHIEKVTLLLHCIAADSKDVVKDYQAVRNELGNYNQLLLNKKEVILLTKSDLIDKAEAKAKADKLGKLAKVMAVSIHDDQSLKALVRILR